MTMSISWGRGGGTGLEVFSAGNAKELLQRQPSIDRFTSSRIQNKFNLILMLLASKEPQTSENEYHIMPTF